MYCVFGESVGGDSALLSASSRFTTLWRQIRNREVIIKDLWVTLF